MACLKLLSWHLCGRGEEDESAENRTRPFPKGPDSRSETWLLNSSLFRGERSTCSFVTSCGTTACNRTRAPTGNRNDFKCNIVFRVMMHCSSVGVCQTFGKIIWLHYQRYDYIHVPHAFFPQTRRLYRIGRQRLPGYFVTTAVLRDTIKVTPCRKA